MTFQNTSKVMGLTPVGGSENSFCQYFDLRTLVHYLHFSQVTNPLIIISLSTKPEVKIVGYWPSSSLLAYRLRVGQGP